MMRSTVRDAAARVYHVVTRGTLKKSNDDPMLQEVDIDLHHNESKTKVERFQQYGFSAHNHKESGPGKDDKAAETLVMFINGNRAHAVVIAIDDRRYRLKKMKEGEVALYDEQGQRAFLRRDRVEVQSHKRIISQIVDKPTQDGSTISESKNFIDQTKDKIQVKHPTLVQMDVPSVVFNSKDITFNSTFIVHGASFLDGETHLGGMGGVPASKKGTIDTQLAADIINTAENVFVT